MPVRPTYPGVYVEEIPSPVRTITGVATSVASFIDFFARGPMNQAVQLLNMGDFEREFGGLHPLSEASYAIQQFFLNGGAEAWVVRTASGAIANASVEISAAVGTPSAALRLTAVHPGAWGNHLRARIEPGISTGEFDLLLTEYGTVDGRSVPLRQERFARLSSVAGPRFVETVVNDPITGSRLVRASALTGTPPAANGTVSAPHPTDPPLPPAPELSVTVGGVTVAVPFTAPVAAPGEALEQIAASIQDALHETGRDIPSLASATVGVIGRQLRILASPGQPEDRVELGSPNPIAAATTAALGFTGPANIQEYSLGAGASPSSAQVGGAAGDDGTPPDATAIIGSFNAKTGLYALRDVDLFNLLCIPRAVELSSATETQAVVAQAVQFCEERRAFFLLDIPPGYDEVTKIKAWVAANDTLRSKNAAVYYPRTRIPDPLNEYRLRDVAASGTVAGLYARTDANRGVWKAPAGTEASLRNVSALTDVLTDPENGVLNPLAINCLRSFPVYGTVCWGARTLDGSDQKGSEWKYIPVRRLALFIEESLYRGTKWAVFEPNDEPLWAQVRLNVGAFMHNLFRQGAFQGRSPAEAYLVKCDAETTTQNDIDLGIVNIVVGFRPLKPAEFVIIKIQQLAGQVQT